MTASTVTLDDRQSPIILAMDVGSSAVRCTAYDGAARALVGMTAQKPHLLVSGPGGSSTADPEALLEALFACVDTVLDRLGTAAEDIAAVGSCTFVANVMGLNDAGRTVTPFTTYADTTSWAQAERLAAELDQEAVRQRVGCYFHPSYLPSRFLLWKEHQGDQFSRVSQWTTLGDFMEQTLFGRSEGARITTSVASWSGMLNRHTLDWDEELIARLALDRATLPTVVDVSDDRSGLRPAFAERWPALENIPWFPAVGDGAAANLGSAKPGSSHTVVITLGTTGAVRVITREPLDPIPDGLWCYRVDREHSLPGGALTEGGSLYDWLHGTLNLTSPAETEKAIEHMAPDQHGLTVLPTLAGERSPGWRGRATATWHGMTLATTPLDIMRAGMESVAFGLGSIFDQMRSLLPDMEGNAVPVVVGGGALAASSAWTQMVADVLGREVEQCGLEGSSSRGVALMVLELLGKNPDEQDTVLTGPVFQPDPGAHEVYGAARERKARLYEMIRQLDDTMNGTIL